MGILPEHMCVHHLYTHYLLRPEDPINISGINALIPLFEKNVVRIIFAKWWLNFWHLFLKDIGLKFILSSAFLLRGRQ